MTFGCVGCHLDLLSLEPSLKLLNVGRKDCGMKDVLTSSIKTALKIVVNLVMTPAVCPR